MRFLIIAGVLVLAAPRPAPAAFQVALDGGDTMTVDSYWEDGDRIHLMRDGVDLNVLRSRVKSLRHVEDAHENAPPKRPSTATASAPGFDAPKPSRKELEHQQRTIQRHLWRAQRERHEAGNREDDAAKLKRLDRELDRTADRWKEVHSDLQKSQQ